MTPSASPSTRKFGRLRRHAGLDVDAGAADDDRLAARAAEIDDVERVALLRQHAAGHHQVGPVEVVVAQFLGVAVDQPQRPGRRQQRRDRDQAERRRRIFGAEDFARPPEIPECVRIEPRIDQKRVARFCTRRVFHPGPPSVKFHGRRRRLLSPAIYPVSGESIPAEGLHPVILRRRLWPEMALLPG